VHPGQLPFPDPDRSPYRPDDVRLSHQDSPPRQPTKRLFRRYQPRMRPSMDPDVHGQQAMIFVVRRLRHSHPGRGQSTGRTS
jgi:hypothetical protein